MINRLANILNASLAAGYFPKKNQRSRHHPHPQAWQSPKQGGKFQTHFSSGSARKNFEKIINKRLLRHLEDTNYLNQRQYGFRRSRGTTIAIALAYEEISQALAINKQCNIILRDISKAFDKVWHDGLRSRLSEPILQATKQLHQREESKNKIWTHHRGSIWPKEWSATRQCYISYFLHNVQFTHPTTNPERKLHLLCRRHNANSNLSQQIKKHHGSTYSKSNSPNK